MSDLEILAQLIAEALDAPKDSWMDEKGRKYYPELKEHIAKYLINNGVKCPK